MSEQTSDGTGTPVATEPAAESQSPEPTPAPTAAKPSNSLAALALAVSAVTLAGSAAGGLWLWQHTSRSVAAAQSDAAQMQEKLAELDGQVAALRSRAPVPAGGEDASRVETLSQQVQQMEQQRAQATAQGGATVDALATQTRTLQAEMQRLSQAVEAVQRNAADANMVLRLSERVESAERAFREMAEQRASAEALLLALSGLRDSLVAGRPFDSELNAIRAIAPDTAEVQQALDLLDNQAETGVLTADELDRNFDQMADEVIRATFLPTDEGWWQETLRRLGSIVTVRREGGDVAGDSPSAILARAESRLANNELDAAIRELEQLSGPEAEVAANWLNDARARIDAESALADLTAQAVARITAKKG